MGSYSEVEKAHQMESYLEEEKARRWEAGKAMVRAIIVSIYE